jgi:BRCA1/BRCA2-containing complex subunit 3
MSDVYRCCFHHALSTQSDEIMGLLIGEKFEAVSDLDDETVLEIVGLLIVRRLDKRPDRVEISPEQMIKASVAAEELAVRLDRPNIRVVGWYHSHPNITILPSHIDLGTQLNFQAFDEHFIGLIFGVFNAQQRTWAHQYKMVAFQAKRNYRGETVQVLIPVEIVPSKEVLTLPVAEQMIRLSEILYEENMAAADDIRKDNQDNANNPLASLKLDLGLLFYRFLKK